MTYQLDPSRAAGFRTSPIIGRRKGPKKVPTLTKYVGPLGSENNESSFIYVASTRETPGRVCFSMKTLNVLLRLFTEMGSVVATGLLKFDPEFLSCAKNFSVRHKRTQACLSGLSTDLVSISRTCSLCDEELLYTSEMDQPRKSLEDQGSVVNCVRTEVEDCSANGISSDNNLRNSLHHPFFENPAQILSIIVVILVGLLIVPKKFSCTNTPRSRPYVKDIFRSAFLLLFLSQGCVAQSSPALVSTMKSIWSSLGGPNTYWAGNNVCSSSDYIGVTCDSTNSYPIEISYSGWKGFLLTGSIPSSMANLVNVTKIDLSNNALTGTIPTSLCNLPLTYLGLSANQLTGPITCFAPQLTYLNLRGMTTLTGPIPSSIYGLTQLVTLWMDTNGLTGSVSPNIGKLVHLQYLNFGVNDLTGSLPDTICNLKSLTYLNFGTNKLSGGIPTCIGNLTLLRQFFMDTNSLTGTVPPSFGNLVSLNQTGFGRNNITGSIPSSVINLPLLVELDFNSNHLNGTVPGRSNLLPGLQSLSLQNNQLLSVGYINVTSSCNLGGNPFYCPTPLQVDATCSGTVSCLAQSDPNIVALMRSVWASLKGPNNYWVCNSADYVGVTCDGTNNYPVKIVYNGGRGPLVGSIPSIINSITNLTTINLNKNALTGSIPNLTNGRLTVLDLSSNQLSGLIPPVTNLASLTYLSLSGNRLNGPIPSSVGSLSSITTLVLSGNNLSGTIPSSLGGLNSLVYLDLSANDFNGTIPLSMGNLTALQTLSLSKNQLSGTISHQVLNLPTLLNLNVSNNILSGAIPERGLDLHPLSSLDLSINQFTSTAGFISVSKACNLTGNPFPCAYLLDVPSNCLVDYLCPSPISDAQANLQIQEIGAAGKIISSEDVYLVLSHLFNNKSSSNPATLNAPSLSVTAYDITRPSLVTRNSTDIQLFTAIESSLNVRGAAAIDLSTLGELRRGRRQNQETSPSFAVLMKYESESGPFSEVLANQSSAVYGFTITDANGSPVEVVDVIENVTVIIPTRGVTAEQLSELYCMFYNEANNTWDNSGCFTERDFINLTITCKCNHLTNFSVGVPSRPSQKIAAAPSPFPTYIIIIAAVAGCILLVSLVALITFIIVKRRHTAAGVTSRDERFMSHTVQNSFVSMTIAEDQKTDREEKIAEGENSVVYRGLQSGVTSVAIKKMKRGVDGTRTQHELWIVKSMHHPNVVLYLSHFSDVDGDINILYELMDWNLANRLRAFRNTVRMLQIAKALSYLESVYIIHTEVAARNVLIKDDTAKLCDFDEGNAIKEGKSHRRRRQESQRWDAPEVMEGQSYSFHSDIWSFGVFCWEVMNDGQTPYGNMSNREARLQVKKYVLGGGSLSNEGELLHNQIMRGCWVMNPNERMSCRHIQTELRSYVAKNEGKKRIVSVTKGETEDPYRFL
ncbi:putative LRR receptor-like serine/threonine-protein kinase [Planoprotostelium fungivorum]|uniref:Putative LRR receptor-like serine/threonine-protein kinase n=1 Tax=Planoprotostelium fungivorum TaxID=1890364 RepID=A0A2P6MXM2_9EUKA|nr:putative LRR receptor-like serine/threonine-protein kinase [Planoprotostelium fungivorum]